MRANRMQTCHHVPLWVHQPIMGCSRFGASFNITVFNITAAEALGRVSRPNHTSELTECQSSFLISGACQIFGPSHPLHLGWILVQPTEYRVIGLLKLSQFAILEDVGIYLFRIKLGRIKLGDGVVR